MGTPRARLPNPPWPAPPPALLHRRNPREPLFFEHRPRGPKRARIVEATKCHRDVVRGFVPMADLGAAASAKDAGDAGRRFAVRRRTANEDDGPQRLMEPGHRWRAGRSPAIPTMADDDLARRLAERVADRSARTATDPLMLVFLRHLATPDAPGMELPTAREGTTPRPKGARSDRPTISTSLRGEVLPWIT